MVEHATLSFGLKTSQSNLSYPQILTAWQDADQISLFDHAWLWDHLVPLRADVRGATLEAWTLLAALAARTERLRLGVLVTSNRLRPPTLLAKMAATVDQISGGRLEFGIGAGASRVADAQVLALVHREFDAYGIDVVSPGAALAALDEACEIVTRLWTSPDPFDYEGRCYTLHGAIGEPKPLQRPRPPIMLGAGGDRALKIVARHADVWNCPARTVKEFRQKSAVLDEHCASLGRDPRQIVRSQQILVPPNDAPQTRQQILDFVAAGATHLVLAPVPPFPHDRVPVRWLADEIITPVLDGSTREQRDELLTDGSTDVGIGRMHRARSVGRPEL